MNREVSLPCEMVRPYGIRSVGMLVLAALAVPLTGCGDHKTDKAASQTAARVNKEEITIHQINLLLQQQRGIKPEQVDAASKQILESLIDQELDVQKSRELKLDQDPRVLLQIEAAKRTVLASAYVQGVADSAAKPTADEIAKYYESKSSLFKGRRIYGFEELNIEAKPEQVTKLREQAQHGKTAGDFVAYLKSTGLSYTGDHGERPAEQFPEQVLEGLIGMKDGEMLLLPTPNGAFVILLTGSRPAPVDEASAKPAIEQFLLNASKRAHVESNAKALRAAAKIEYIGKFADTKASGVANGPAQTASAPAQPQPSLPASAAGGMSADAITKGMGIKP